MANNKGKREKERNGLVRSCEAARILEVSREYVRQLVTGKILPPKYLFNANSWRKVYIFDRKLVEKYKFDKKSVKWKEPEPCYWMTAIELSQALNIPVGWIYNANRKGFLDPEIVIASSKQKLRLYDRAKVEEVMTMNTDRRSNRRGHSKKTLQLMEKIQNLHNRGLNDSHIAIKTKSTQPFISKLRKEMGLLSNARIASAKRKALLEAKKTSGGKVKTKTKDKKKYATA